MIDTKLRVVTSEGLSLPALPAEERKVDRLMEIQHWRGFLGCAEIAKMNGYRAEKIEAAAEFARRRILKLGGEE